MKSEDIVLTDSVVDDLLDDWIERDGATYVHKRKKGRIGWEKTLEHDEAYSAYLLEAPTQEDLIKRAYSLANDMITVMDPPFKVHVKITTGSVSGYSTVKEVCVGTSMFDDPELSVGEKLDTFLGVTIHEGCHLLYTDFKEMSHITTGAEKYIFNTIEDERIEMLCGDNKPGLANFLEKSKYYFFDQYYLDYVEPKKREDKLTPFDRIMNCFLQIIRYPKYLDEKEIIEFGQYLVKIKEVVLPYPKTTAAAAKVARKVFEIVKDLYVDEEKKSDAEKGDDSFPADATLRAMKKLTEDVESASSALEKVAGGSTSAPSEHGGSGIKSSDEARVVSEMGELLGEVCEGKVELGGERDTFFTKGEDNRGNYLMSLERVKRYVPAIAKIMKGHAKEYKLIHRSMRSGLLDTNKLAEAFQGVPTVYLREGEVKTDKVAVCVLIDESGSMSGERIRAARDTAVLINEALGQVPNVELFIYGHTGDIRKTGATEMSVYRESNYHPKYALGSVNARCENRDGVAILETAKRVRKQTKNPVLMFILSDGSPAASCYRGESAMTHVRECVQKVENMGFYLIQVCINHVYDPGKMFKHYVIMEDMGTLALRLSTAIKKATMQTAKVRVS